MPAVNTNTAWFQLAEVYGKPYGGSPPIGLDLSDFHENGVNHFMMNQDANHGYARAWTDLPPTTANGTPSSTTSTSRPTTPARSRSTSTANCRP